MLANGAIYDLDKGRIVANPGGGTHAITSDNARQFLARRRAVGLRSRLRGVVRGVGGKLPDETIDEITDDLLASAGDAIEAATAHMTGVFMKSSGLRGMGDVYEKLIEPLIGDKRVREEAESPDQGTPLVNLAQYITVLVNGAPSADNLHEAIDGELSDE